MDKPVPIAFCITDLDPGGAERALVQIVTRLDRNEWAPAVYCLGTRGALASRLEQHEIPVTCLGAKSLRDFRVIGELTRRLRDERPMILQSFLFHANIAGRYAGRRAGVPIVVSGIRVAERGSRWHLWAERLTRSMVTHHVCVSAAVAEFSIEKLGLNRDQVSVIPNGVDVESILSAEPADLASQGIPNDSKTLLFVGRLHKQKGVDILLEAIRPLAERHPELRLLLAGEGPLEPQIRQWIHDKQLEKQIRVLGYRDDVPSLMRASSALVLPSLWEGLPNVVLEAMAARLPVICTDVDGSRDLVVSESTGWLAKPGSATSLQSTIEQWLGTDPLLIRGITERSQAIVSEQFTWTIAANKHAELYRRLMAERSAI